MYCTLGTVTYIQLYANALLEDVIWYLLDGGQYFRTLPIAFRQSFLIVAKYPDSYFCAATVLETHLSKVLYLLAFWYFCCFSITLFSIKCLRNRSVLNSSRFRSQFCFGSSFYYRLSTRVGRSFKTQSGGPSNWLMNRFVCVVKRSIHLLAGSHQWEKRVFQWSDHQAEILRCPQQGNNENQLYSTDIDYYQLWFMGVKRAHVYDSIRTVRTP